MASPPPWANSPLLVLASRLASIAAVLFGILGTTIASLAVWIFLRASDELSAVSRGMGSLITKVAVHEEQIRALSADQIVLRKRIDGLQARSYEVGR